MMTPTSKAFRESFVRCVRKPGFAESFYDALMSLHPGFAPLFEETDMGQLGSMLNRALHAAVAAMEGESTEARQYLKALGRYHAAMHVARPDYDLWIEAIVQTVAAYDPYYSEETAVTWRQTLSSVADLMTEERDPVPHGH